MGLTPYIYDRWVWELTGASETLPSHLVGAFSAFGAQGINPATITNRKEPKDCEYCAHYEHEWDK
jgi:hypothetical protein